MNGNIQIRSATIDDAESLCATERLIASQPGHLVSRPDELSPEMFRRKISELDHGRAGCYVVATCREQIVGHGLLDPSPLAQMRHIVRLNLVVHPDWQGNGIGKAILAHLVNWGVRSEGVEKIALLVRATNDRAIALYRKLGFVDEGVLRGRVRISAKEYIDDVAMGLWLKPILDDDSAGGSPRTAGQSNWS